MLLFLRINPLKQRMKIRPIAYCFILYFLVGCYGQKLAEYRRDKAAQNFTLHYVPVTEVSKKNGLNVVFNKYLGDAPADSILIEIINQYTCFYLHEYGFEQIHIAGNEETITEKEARYHFQVAPAILEIKEYKFTETVSDTATGTQEKIKLRGVKTSISAGVTPYENGTPNFELSKKANAATENEESLHGEFAHTKNLKDLIKGNKDGSQKYLKDIEKLEDGLFVNQCIRVAQLLAENINDKVEMTYHKQKKEALRRAKARAKQ